MERRFAKGDVISHDGSGWKCIVCDDECAAFGAYEEYDGGVVTSYEKTFVVSNVAGKEKYWDGFVYELIARQRA